MQRYCCCATLSAAVGSIRGVHGASQGQGCVGMSSHATCSLQSWESLLLRLLLTICRMLRLLARRASDWPTHYPIPCTHQLVAVCHNACAKR